MHRRRADHCDVAGLDFGVPAVTRAATRVATPSVSIKTTYLRTGVYALAAYITGSFSASPKVYGTATSKAMLDSIS